MPFDYLIERRYVDQTVKHAYDQLECAALGRLSSEWRNAIDICRGQEFNIHVLMDLHIEGVILLRRRWDYELKDGKKVYTSAEHEFCLKEDR